LGDFIASQNYWPVPDKVFNAFPFFSWCSFASYFCWINDICIDFK
jgi:hypothetical protein